MTKFKAAISILLVFVMLLGIAACGKKGDEETTLDETTTEAEEVTEDESVDPDATTDPAAEVTTEATTTGGDTNTTVAPATPDPTPSPTPSPTPDGNAPVGTDKAKIVEYYNKAANALKSYTGKVTLTKKEGAYTKVEEFGISALKKTAEDALPNTWGKAQPVTVVFEGGKGKEGDKDRTLQQFLPPEEKPHMSKLTAAGIASANCTKDGSNYKVVIKLVKEVGNNVNFVPTHHSSAMNTLSITDKDLGDFKVSNATVTYEGATITAVINAEGRILSLDIKEPALIVGKVGHKSVPLVSASAKLSGGYNIELSVKW